MPWGRQWSQAAGRGHGLELVLLSSLLLSSMLPGVVPAQGSSPPSWVQGTRRSFQQPVASPFQPISLQASPLSLPALHPRRDVARSWWAVFNLALQRWAARVGQEESPHYLTGICVMASSGFGGAFPTAHGCPGLCGCPPGAGCGLGWAVQGLQ